jgi:hypothetical protein
MLTDIFHWVLATFLFTPLQAELDQRMQAAQAPRAAIEHMQTCVAAATPVLIGRATSDWVWGATTVIGLATGLSDPKQLLAGQVPACRPAIQALRPVGQAGV